MGTDQWPFIGHQQFGQIAIRLQDEGRWPSVVLLRGPAHIGKRAIAMWLAQRSLCQSTQRPCGVCSSCQAVTEQRHPSVHVVDGEVGSISIDTVRAIQQGVRIKSQGVRVILLLNIEQVTESAANSLLKLLEEPPERVHIIATTARPGMLPDTLRSRMQQFYLRTISVRDVPAEDRSRIIAAEGRIGIVEEWKSNPELLRQEQGYIDDFLQFLQGKQRAGIGDEFERRLELEADVLRQLFFQHVGIRRSVAWEVAPDVLASISQRLTFQHILSALNRYQQRSAYLLTNVSPRNVYEDLHQQF